MLDWTPEGGGRSDGRALKRWHEDIVGFFRAIGHKDKEAWRIAATCREEWASLEEEFCSIHRRKKKSQR